MGSYFIQNWNGIIIILVYSCLQYCCPRIWLSKIGGEAGNYKDWDGEKPSLISKAIWAWGPKMPKFCFPVVFQVISPCLQLPTDCKEAECSFYSVIGQTGTSSLGLGKG